MWWVASMVQCPRLRVSRRCGDASCGVRLVTPGGLAVALGGLDLDGLAPDGEDLSDAGEVEVVVERAGDPDGAALAAPVLGFGALVGEVRCTLGDVLVEGEPDIVEHVRLVALDGEQVVCAAPEEIGGQRALGEQGIGGDGVPCDVGHRLEQGEDGADLVCALLRFVGVRASCRFFLLQGRFGVVADDAEHMRLAALVIEGAAQRLAVDGQGSVA